jgi:hypothetical protein
MAPHADPAYRATYGDAEFRALLTAIFVPGQEWAERLPHIQACVAALGSATAQGTFRNATPMAKHKAPYLLALALTAVQLIRPNRIGPDEYARLHALLSWQSGYRSSSTLPSLAGAASRNQAAEAPSTALVAQTNYLVPERVDPNLLRPGNRSVLQQATASLPQQANPPAQGPDLLFPGNRSGPGYDRADLLPRVQLAGPRRAEPAENGFSYPWQEAEGYTYVGDPIQAPPRRAERAPPPAPAPAYDAWHYVEAGREQAMAIAAAARERASRMVERAAVQQIQPGFTVATSSDPFARPNTTSPSDDPLQAAAKALPGAGVAMATYAPALLAGAALLGGLTYAAYRLMASRSTPEAVQMRDALARSTLDAAFEQLRDWPDQPQSVRIPAFLDLLQEQAWHTEAMDALLQVTGVALQPEVHLVFTRPRGAPRPADTEE